MIVQRSRHPLSCESPNTQTLNPDPNNMEAWKHNKIKLNPKPSL